MEVALTNMTSIPYTICLEGQNQNRISPFCTISLKVGKDTEVLRLSVLNMFCSKDRHPVVELPLK